MSSISTTITTPTTTRDAVTTAATAGRYTEEFNGIGYHHADNLPLPSAVESLLNECLQYHQEQEIIRSQNNSIASRVHPTTSPVQHSTHNDHVTVIPTVSVSSSSFVPPQFIPSVLTSSSEIVAPTTSDSLTEQQERIDQARERAQKILLRFQQQQQVQQTTPSDVCTNTDIDPTKASTTLANDSRKYTMNDIDYVRQRQIGLQREEQRRQTAIIKNLQYVMHQQQRRIEQLTSTIVASTQQPPLLPPSVKPENERQAYHRHESPSAVTDKSDANINGANDKKQRNRNDPKCRASLKNRNAQTYDASSTSTTSTNTVAIYISTNPLISTDYDNEPPETLLYWNESFLHQLFQTYGTIRNIYLYRHKKKKNHQTNCLGGYKGDGIIVYKLLKANTDDADNAVQRQTLMDLICGQVRVTIFFHANMHTKVFAHFLYRFTVR